MHIGLNDKLGEGQENGVQGCLMPHLHHTKPSPY